MKKGSSVNDLQYNAGETPATLKGGTPSLRWSGMAIASASLRDCSEKS
ncbi:MAG: hypothetical protein JXM79_23905 [Sedimentisphaerales bacterium]|nr:hypothetical protein [Sedimentisphaerales bacterium]